MTVRVQKSLLWGSLAAVAAYVLLDEPARQPGLALAQSPNTESRAPKAPPAERLDLPDRRGLSGAQGELFAAPPPPAPKSVAKKAQPPAPVPAAPVAPPMPYRFAGKIINGSEQELFVAKGDSVIPVKVGDTLDGLYKVESISAERIEIVYLPLGTRDRIAVSSALDAEPTQAPLAAAPAPTPAAPNTASASAATNGGPAQLRWEGPDRVAAGESFTVTLRVSTSELLRAAPMQLRFAPDVLQPVNVQPGKFFGQGNFTYRVNSDGSIFVGASSPAAAAGDDAELVVVTFRPIKGGTTAELRMGALNLQGASGRAIAHEQPSAFRTAIQ
jgi:Cohesin domain